MGKKKKIVEEQQSIEPNIPGITFKKLMEDTMDSYVKYLEFIDCNKIDEIVLNSMRKYKITDGISPELQIRGYIKDGMYSLIIDEIRNDCLDAEILMVEDFRRVLNLVGTKMKIDSETMKNQGESYLEKAIETAPNTGINEYVVKVLKDSFKAGHFVGNEKQDSKEAKNSDIFTSDQKVDEKKQVKKDNVKMNVSTVTEPKFAKVLTVKEEDTYIEPKVQNQTSVVEKQPVVNKEQSKVKNIKLNVNKIQELIHKNLTTMCIATNLDRVGNTLDILGFLDTDDEMYKAFCYLKYGYKDGRYFGVNEISKILDISCEETINYYFMSLDEVALLTDCKVYEEKQKSNKLIRTLK